ncbi:MAG: hypothetical protein K2X47_12775 [Bdellovibrionales bacterium]|nr:hypothetical protein [Bdellovibrionales bacterium]
MAFEDIKDRVREAAQAQWNALQETSSYIQAKEKYDDLPTLAQWGVKIGAGILAILLVLVLPLSWLSTGTEQISYFEDNRNLIKDYLKTAKGLQNLPEVIPQLSAGDVKAKVDPIIQSMNLLPEQIKETRENTFTAEAGSQLIPNTLVRQGVEVHLSKLNLTQSVDLAYKLQTLGEGLKLIGLEVERSPAESHYYEAKFRVVSFSVANKGADSKAPKPTASEESEKAQE